MTHSEYMKALAGDGEGLHVSGVRVFVLTLLASALLSAPCASAQTRPNTDKPADAEPDALQVPRPNTPDPDDPLPWPGDELGVGEPDLDDGNVEIETGEDPGLPDAPPAPDYSNLPPLAERAARLDALHARLATEGSKETAQLISEEIWAIWMDSGSASVNYLLERSDDAFKRGDTVEGKRMLDLMLELEPDFAEAWSRSARMALTDEDYGRAAAHATEALIRNPRHYYSMWTLGNVLERLGRDEEALEVYEEAHALFPKLGNVKERLDRLRSDVLGDVL